MTPFNITSMTKLSEEKAAYFQKLLIYFWVYWKRRTRTRGHGHADRDRRTVFADSFLRTVPCGQFFEDSFLRTVFADSFCGQFFADSFLRTVFCGQFFADSFLRTVFCGQFFADSFLRTVMEKTGSYGKDGSRAFSEIFGRETSGVAAIFPFVNGRCQHEQSLPTLYPFISLCVPDINYTRDAIHPGRRGRLSLARPSGSRFS